MMRKNEIYGENLYSKREVHSEADVLSYDKAQLVQDATLIVSREVVGFEVQDDADGFPATDYLIKVDHAYKGDAPETVEVRTAGGENERMRYFPNQDQVTFHQGEQVVVFLTDQKGDRKDRFDFGYFVVGQAQGKFVEENGKLRNAKLTFDSLTFEKELHSLEEPPPNQ
jgi:hypothetical protein